MAGEGERELHGARPPARLSMTEKKKEIKGLMKDLWPIRRSKQKPDTCDNAPPALLIAQLNFSFGVLSKSKAISECVGCCYIPSANTHSPAHTRRHTHTHKHITDTNTHGPHTQAHILKEQTQTTKHTHTNTRNTQNTHADTHM